MVANSEPLVYRLLTRKNCTRPEIGATVNVQSFQHGNKRTNNCIFHATSMALYSNKSGNALYAAFNR